MKINIFTWNIKAGCDIDKIITLIQGSIIPNEPNVFCLQEVLENKNTLIENIFGKNNTAYSLALRPAKEHEGVNRNYGLCTIAINCELVKHQLIEYSVFPERTQFIKILAQGKLIGIVNFHSLTGVHYKKAKSSNFKSIASFISEHETEIDFLCFDANEPKKDYFSLDKVEFYDNFDKGTGAALIMGSNKIHSLNDAFRSFYRKNGTENQNEPLEISHINRGHKKRFDYIFHSPEWTPEFVNYKYDDSIKASSDHAMVKGVFLAND